MIYVFVENKCFSKTKSKIPIFTNPYDNNYTFFFFRKKIHIQDKNREIPFRKCNFLRMKGIGNYSFLIISNAQQIFNKNN